MTVSAAASKIYQAAKKATEGIWMWKKEWSKAMKKAWRKVMSTEKCTKELWNHAAAKHVRGQAGLLSLVRSIADEIGTADFQEVANHWYGRFLRVKKNNRQGHYNFGLYLNQMYDKYCK